jgi:hypothetical protein
MEVIIISWEDLDDALELELGTRQQRQIWGYCPNCFAALEENDCIDPDNDTFECVRCDETFHVSDILRPDELETGGNPNEI